MFIQYTIYVCSISIHAVSYFKEGNMVLILLNKCLAWPYSKKAILAWTECSDIKHWLTKYAQLFELFAGVQWLLILLVFYKHMLLIRQVLLQEGVSKAKCYIHHSHIVSSTYADHYNPCFLTVSSSIGLKQYSQCCNNLSYIFIHTYFYC